LSQKEICDILNVLSSKDPVTIYERSKNMVDMYVNGVFKKKINLFDHQKCELDFNCELLLEFFEEDTNIPFEFLSPFVIHLELKI
jgi:hypothetical protein